MRGVPEPSNAVVDPWSACCGTRRRASERAAALHADMETHRTLQDRADRVATDVSRRWRAGKVDEKVARWEIAGAVLQSKVVEEAVSSKAWAAAGSCLVLDLQEKVEQTLLAKMVHMDGACRVSLDLNRLAEGAKVCAWARRMAESVAWSSTKRLREHQGRTVTLDTDFGAEDHYDIGIQEQTSDVLVDQLCDAQRRSRQAERPHWAAEAVVRMFDLPPVERGVSLPDAAEISTLLQETPNRVVEVLDRPDIEQLFAKWDGEQVAWLRTAQGRLAAAAIVIGALSPRYPARKARLGAVAARVSAIAGITPRKANSLVRRWDAARSEVTASAFDASCSSRLKSEEERAAAQSVWERTASRTLPDAKLDELDAVLNDLLWFSASASAAA